MPGTAANTARVILSRLNAAMARRIVVGLTSAMLLVALVVGAPLMAGVEALTWPTYVNSGEATLLGATLRLTRRHSLALEPPDAAWFWDDPFGPTCMGRLLRRGVGGSDDDVLAQLALRQDRLEWYRGNASWAAETSLLKLPRFAIGALDGCVRGSLAAVLCDAWTGRRVRVAIAAARPALLREAAAHARFVERIACRLIATKPNR